MNWTKLLYVLVITLLYVPMVFLGANVFFPKYTGSNSYYQPTSDCYLKYQNGGKELTPEQQAGIEQCNAEQRAAQTAFEDARAVYNGWKYTGIVAFNLVVLLVALFVTGLMDAVMMGLFFGAVVTAFGATVTYWDYARTPIGFILMLAAFVLVIIFVNQRAKMLHDWKKK
ncbi:MAG TPA: hypothetical protein VLJ21_00030 [Candidatus Binatia bacterium]|nr:hypothetical protein [Candidatus Binatia bacterium]